MMINWKYLSFKQPNKSRLAGHTGVRAKRRRCAILGACGICFQYCLCACLLPFHQKHCYLKVGQKYIVVSVSSFINIVFDREHKG